MPQMTAMQAAVKVLESEGVERRVRRPGAAILPFYEALRESPIRHYLVRHEEGGTHTAEGYTRARAGRIGVNVGTSGPAGTDMITGLYSAIADSMPILCITGQAPRAKLHKEDFQAIDIAAIARPVTKWSVCVMEGAPGAMGVSQGVPDDARRPAGAGPYRPAARRPAGDHRVRSRGRPPARGGEAAAATRARSRRRSRCSLRPSGR